MKLDSHVHVTGHEVIVKLRDAAAAEGVTHYVAILNDLSLIEHLDKAGARGIPFYRLKEPLAPVKTHDPESRVAGYKLHLRHPITKSKDGETLSISEKHMGGICDRAARLGRPLLFHTDADRPEICSLPMLAELAECHPQTVFIAAHTGVLTQEYQGSPYEPGVWKTICERTVRQNLKLLCEVENLYADTALLGRDFPERSPDPEYKLELFAGVVEGLSPAERNTLVNKLFVGTDFPCFWEAANEKSGYRYQIECMRRVFGPDFDVNQMSRNFLNLLPEEIAARYV